MYSEEEIINGCLNKNKLFEDLLYNRFASITYAICLRYVADVDDAKDVFQEAFVKVYTQLKNYKNEGSFDGWVKRIFVNLALDYCRKNRKISFKYSFNQGVKRSYIMRLRYFTLLCSEIYLLKLIEYFLLLFILFLYQFYIFT